MENNYVVDYINEIEKYKPEKYDLKIKKVKTMKSGISDEDLNNYEKTIAFNIECIVNTSIDVFLNSLKITNIKNKKKEINLRNSIYKINESVKEKIKECDIFKLLKRLKEKGFLISYFSQHPNSFSENDTLYGHIIDYEYKNKNEKFIEDKVEIVEFCASYVKSYRITRMKFFIYYLDNILKIDEELSSVFMPYDKCVTFGKPSCRNIVDYNVLQYNGKETKLSYLTADLIKSIYVGKIIGTSKPYTINIGVDFDGVLHKHNIPFETHTKELNFEPCMDVIEFINYLAVGFKNSLYYNKAVDVKIHIFTMRAYDKEYVKQVKAWLRKYTVFYSSITKDFKNFDFYFDDRGINMPDMQNAMNYIGDIIGFKVWHKQNPFGNKRKKK